MKLDKLINFLSSVDKEFEDCYVVGGILRDLFINKDLLKEKNNFDIDICIKNLQVEKIEKLVSKHKLPFIVLDEENLVYRSVIKEDNFLVSLDFSSYNSLEEDILRRDFTINTLYLKLNNFIKFLCSSKRDVFINNLEDKLKARYDIKNKLLKLVSKNSLKEDPLRILRAARFYTLGFVPEKNIEKLIKKQKKLLKKVSSERILDELKKIFNSNNSYKVLEWMDKNGILDEIFPEIKMVKVKGKNTQFKKFYFHKEGLWQHIKLTYDSIEKILLNLKNYFPEDYNEISLKIKDKEYILKFISLFHDVAKPLVAQKIKGRVRFFHHEIKSCEISHKVLSRLKMSKEDIFIITEVIKNHMRIGSLCAMRDNLTQRAYLRLFRDTDEYFYFLLVFSLADRMSYEKVPVKERKKYFKNFSSFSEFLRFLNKLLEIYKDYKIKLSMPKLLNGHEVMNIFNIPEGPLVGKILNLIRDAQLLGKISDKKEAIILARKYLKNYKLES